MSPRALTPAALPALTVGLASPGPARAQEAPPANPPRIAHKTRNHLPEMTDTGSGSRRNPSAATAASRKAQVDAMVSASVQFIERWKQLRPVGTP